MSVLVVTCALGLLASPLAAQAQPGPATPRIGILHGIRSPFVETFVEGLRDLGWVEGKNIVLERRSADGALERLPGLAAELVRLNVRVIFTPATAGTRAAQEATTTIPIVFAGVADPVGSGFIKAFAKPGGNISGLTALNVELTGKRLELLREAMPQLKQVGILTDSQDPAFGAIVKEAELVAPRIALRVKPIDVKVSTALSGVFAGLHHESIQGLMVGGRMFQYRERIAELARANRLGTMADSRAYVEAGMLMAYGTDYGELARRAAIYVDKILKGAKPADLPVEQPTKFELAINLKTAKALGLTIPPSLLLRAERIVK